MAAGGGGEARFIVFFSCFYCNLNVPPFPLVPEQKVRQITKYNVNCR